MNKQEATTIVNEYFTGKLKIKTPSYYEAIDVLTKENIKKSKQKRDRNTGDVV